jgi:hypothetical protein
MPVPVRLAVCRPLVPPGLNAVRHLKVHQWLQDQFRQGAQKVLTPGCPSRSKNAMLSSAIVYSTVRLSFALSTLPEFAMAAHLLPSIYTTFVDSSGRGEFIRLSGCGLGEKIRPHPRYENALISPCLARHERNPWLITGGWQEGWKRS